MTHPNPDFPAIPEFGIEALPDSRSLRAEILVPGPQMDGFRVSDSAWHETIEDIDQALAYGKIKKRALARLRRIASRELSRRERECLVLRYFKGLSYRDAATKTRTTASSVHRAVRRAIRKLRVAVSSSRPSQRLRDRPRGPAPRPSPLD